MSAMPMPVAAPALAASAGAETWTALGFPAHVRTPRLDRSGPGGGLDALAAAAGGSPERAAAALRLVEDFPALPAERVLAVDPPVLHAAAPARPGVPAEPPAGARLLCVPADLLAGVAAAAAARRLLRGVPALVVQRRRARVVPLPDGLIVDLRTFWDVETVLAAPAARMPDGDDPVLAPLDAPPLVPAADVRRAAALACSPAVGLLVRLPTSGATGAGAGPGAPG